MCFFLPADCDTSSPVEMTWAVRTDDNTAGDIQWQIRWSYTSEGDNVFTSSAAAPPTGPNEQLTTLIEAAPTAVNDVKYYTTDLDISDMVARKTGTITKGDVLWISLERDGGAGSYTHSGDVALIQIVFDYIKWCVGGHSGT